MWLGLKEVVDRDQLMTGIAQLMVDSKKKLLGSSGCISKWKAVKEIWINATE